MSWQATAWAIKQKTGSPSCKLLLLMLASYANERGGNCWPSQTTLANGTEQSLDTIQRNSRRLEAKGLISIERNCRTSGKWPSLTYQLCMPVEKPVEPNDGTRSRSTPVNKSDGLRLGRAAEPRSPGRKLCGMNLQENNH